MALTALAARSHAFRSSRTIAGWNRSLTSRFASKGIFHAMIGYQATTRTLTVNIRNWPLGQSRIYGVVHFQKSLAQDGEGSCADPGRSLRVSGSPTAHGVVGSLKMPPTARRIVRTVSCFCSQADGRIVSLTTLSLLVHFCFSLFLRIEFRFFLLFLFSLISVSTLVSHVYFSECDLKALPAQSIRCVWYLEYSVI